MFWKSAPSETIQSAPSPVWDVTTCTSVPLASPCDRAVAHSFLKALRGTRTTTRDFMYMSHCYWNLWKKYTHLDFHSLNPPWEKSGFWLNTSYHVLRSIWQVLDCPSRCHAAPVPQIKYTRIKTLVLNLSFSNLAMQAVFFDHLEKNYW